jgi:hypothetical protein
MVKLFSKYYSNSGGFMEHPQPKFLSKKKPLLPISNAQMEGMLKAIPAGWTIAFRRPTLRPDVLEMTIRRPDGVAFVAKSTGAMLLDKPEGDFMSSISQFISNLMMAKKKQGK